MERPTGSSNHRGSDDLDTQLAALTAVVEHGFEHQRRVDFERHAENRERLKIIEALQRETNGRVNKHDVQIMQLLDKSRQSEDDVHEALTFKTAARYIAAVGASIATTWWVLTVLLNFHR